MESDLSVLEAARRMERDALAVIFDRYASALYNYAYRMCGDPLKADHVVGDVFTKFLEQLSAGKGPHTNLRSYLYEMTHPVSLMGGGFPAERFLSKSPNSNIKAMASIQRNQAWRTRY